jgi:hypothetical protein
MATKKTKFLIETSVVRAALGDSTRDHARHVGEQIQGGKLYTSVYLRMEFIRRWFCDAARMAFAIDQFRDVSDALVFLEQDFSPRNMKGNLAALARALRVRGVMDNSRAAAEEMASIAIAWLRSFDRLFESRIPNTCKCRIGARVPDVDYSRLFEDLRQFYEAFLTPVTDCEVNGFLQLQNPKARAQLLLADEKASRLSAAKQLASLRDEGRWITCKECAKIGDAVIALEQPGSWCLVHLDNSFNELCRVLDRPHKQVKSVQQVTKESLGASEQPPPAG